MKRYLTEFIGTFFLSLTIFLNSANPTPWAPLAVGASLIGVIYMGSHISGAHYSPAVTFAFFLRGACESATALPYWLAQLAGAIAASAAGAFLSHAT